MTAPAHRTAPGPVDLEAHGRSSPAVRAPDSRWTGMAGAVVTVIAFAVASGWLTPRGPVTTGQALTAMALAFVVGVVVAAATGSRWSLLLAPVGFVVVFELVRVGATGPTVDLLAANTLLGWLAFLLGRAVHGLLVVVPMTLGGLFGLELTARTGWTSARRLRPAGRVGTAVLVVIALAIGALVARPAATAPILGPDGQPVPGSVAELSTVTVGGHEQALMIRGVDIAKPVLLHLAGGPGGTDIGAMRLDAGLEQHFVVVTWDQRGTGKSYPAFDPAETLTVDQVVSDTVEVTHYLRQRFGQERIYLAGQSWGTIPAALAAQRHPELYHALVSTGQMVDVAETDRIFYDDALTWAQETGRQALAAQLEAVGPPPYDNPLTGYPVLNDADRAQNAYPEFDGRTEMTATIWKPEYTLVEQVNALRGLADTYARLYPQLQSLDLRASVPRLEIPVYVVMGRHESPGRMQPARQWFDALDAPAKNWVVFDGSGHRANFERPADYTRLLTQVLADTASPAVGSIPAVDLGTSTVARRSTALGLRRGLRRA